MREGPFQICVFRRTYGDFEVVATVEDGKDAVDFCQNHQVNIALMDVRMPNMNGVEATKVLSETTSTKTVILTTFDDDEYILEAIQNGDKGYLLKNTNPE